MFRFKLNLYKTILIYKNRLDRKVLYLWLANDVSKINVFFMLLHTLRSSFGHWIVDMGSAGLSNVQL